jgi:cytoskeletal protein CcmA (bactofilin family)
MFSRRDASNTSQPVRDEPVNRVETPISTPIATPAPAPAPAPTQQASTTTNESLIAQEDTFEGQLKTANGVRVLGTVRGSIESQRSVRVEEGAHVEADITADEVVIAGTYSGALTCRNRVEITSSGRVSGKLDTVKLHLHEGGFFDGELHMQRPGEETARPVEGDGLRARRSRYVDIASESPKPATENANEVGKSGETSS